MNTRLLHFHTILEYVLLIITLIILIFYTYAYFLVVPYTGLTINPSNGLVENIYFTSTQINTIQVGDHIVRVGQLYFDDYKHDLNHSLFEGANPGDVIEIVILRNGKTLSISWALPLITNDEFRGRVLSQWWIAYVFLLFGTLSILFVRPRDHRRLLLIGFNFMTAVWLIAGAPSSFRIWGSPIILRIAIWFCVPVYWQFHHRVFQVYEGNKGSRFWVIPYLIAGALGIGELFRLLPYNAFYIGFILAIVGSLLILILHAWVRPKQRRELSLLGLVFGLTLTPIIVATMIGGLSRFTYSSLISFIVLPILPGTYYYIIYRRQLGNLELRANRIVIFYIFGLILVTIVLLVILAITPLLGNGESNLVTILISLTTSILSILIYPKFEKWAEHKLLGLPIPPSQLLETFAIRITTSLDQERLVFLLRNQILPALLIRQAALLRLDQNFTPNLILEMGVTPSQLPTLSEIQVLLNQVGQHLTKTTDGKPSTPFQWVRLVFELRIENDLIGLFLVGRRDPDDYYSPREILTLQALANQSALALKNIEQARNLLALYQNDLRNQEAESNRLARELHDHVLGQLAMVMMNIDRPSNEFFDQAYHTAVRHIRTIIDGLRPAMLNYGLYIGLQHLVEEIQSFAVGEIKIDYQLPFTQIRYPSEVEFHIYRIIQQACNNVLKHAKATSLVISGFFEEGKIELNISDNGVGFRTDNLLSLNDLLTMKHFGLAGMYERANLIGATMKISSTTNRGTQIQIIWSEN